MGSSSTDKEPPSTAPIATATDAATTTPPLVSMENTNSNNNGKDDDNDGGDNPYRKRRLSKREQRDAKKQRRQRQQEQQWQQQKERQPKERCEGVEKSLAADAATTTTMSNKKRRKKKRNKKKKHQSTEDGGLSAVEEDSDRSSTRTEPSSSVNPTTTTVTTRTVDDDPIDWRTDYEPLDANGDGVGEEEEHNDATSRALGSWFPKARVIKTVAPSSDVHDTCSLLLFYQYARPEWEESRVDALLRAIERAASARNLGGRVRVAREGVNATVSGLGPRPVRHLAEDLRRFDPAVFGACDNFKYVDGLPLDRAFKDMKLLPVRELVYYGDGDHHHHHHNNHNKGGRTTDDADAPAPEGGVHLSPREYHERLSSSDTVVVDVRNHYEAAIGRLDCPGYVDPGMRKSTDFARWLARDDTATKLENKNVLMYCTGGVRCERASVRLKETMGDRVKGVYQLKGGVENYLRAFPDGGAWRGKNFVFDKRGAVSADEPAGDGGVIVAAAGADRTTDAPEGARCCRCAKPWDRYVGKRKCSTCGVPVLVCDACLSETRRRTTNDDETTRERSSLSSSSRTRCPLCVRENVTVLLEDVEYTDNGVGATTKRDKDNAGAATAGAVAPSVLKWGGGHAATKKERRRRRRHDRTTTSSSSLSKGAETVTSTPYT